MGWKKKYRRANRWTTQILGIKAWAVPYLILCAIFGITPDLETIRENQHGIHRKESFDHQ